MELLTEYNEMTATLIARVFLGLLFFFQGFDAVFKVKVSNVIEAYQATFENKGIPRFLTVCGSWFTSYVELIGGLLLILGLFQCYALPLLGINLIIASIAFGIVSPMWDMRFVFPRLALLLFLLVVPSAWDYYSIDHLITVLNK
jgi:putative oxidoreductase